MLKSDPEEYLFKLIVVGDSGVGKSSLMLRYTSDVFSEAFIFTIGVEIKVKSVAFDGDLIKLQIWDVAGQDRYRDVVSRCFRGAHGALVVYDCTNVESFRSVRGWVELVRKKTNELIQIFLVANKLDRRGLNPATVEVSSEEGEKLAQELDCRFITCSAATGTKATEVFEALAVDLHRSYSADRVGPQLEVTQMKRCCSIM